MLPPDVDQRTLRVSSICFEGGTHRVLWSHVAASDDSPTVSALEDADIPLGILPDMAPQDSIVLTELRTHWQPSFLNVGLGAMFWRSELVGRPRFVKIIPHTGINATNVCSAAA